MEKYQTFWLRFAALIIDGIITAVVGSILSLIFSPFAVTPKFAIILNSAIGVMAVFYYILLHARYGQTLGKKVMSLKVLDLTEKPITLAQAVIRSLPQLFPVFVGASFVNFSARPNPDYDTLQIFTIALNSIAWLWYIADIIVCVSSDKKRALHDFIAGTVVVKTNATNISITP